MLETHEGLTLCGGSTIRLFIQQLSVILLWKGEAPDVGPKNGASSKILKEAGSSRNGSTRSQPPFEALPLFRTKLDENNIL